MRSILAFALVMLLAASVYGGGVAAPVGAYLYANQKLLPDAQGGLEITFKTGNSRRLVIAWGWRYRKTQVSRKGVSNDAKEVFKPRLAQLTDGGNKAVFSKLPPDFYDIIIIDEQAMVILEGVTLQQAPADELYTPEEIASYKSEIRKSLGVDYEGQASPWESFFDTKELGRAQFDDDGNACVLLQQMRKAKSFAESGAEIQGCIHSVDVVWVCRSKGEGNGWQVINRQQLFRDEMGNKDFFSINYKKELSGIRIGSRVKAINVDF